MDSSCSSATTTTTTTTTIQQQQQKQPRLAVGVDDIGELFGLAVVVPSGLAVGVDDIGELAIWACSGRW